MVDSNGENGVQFLFGLYFHELFRPTIGIKVVLVYFEMSLDVMHNRNRHPHVDP